jgi:hypothetical protein
MKAWSIAKVQKQFTYYVNYDWALPIAYVYDEALQREYPGKTMVPQ